MKAMVLKNLNDVSIFIAPLLDDKITINDLTAESGFVNAYTSDINRPYLENKVFLLYDSQVNTKESLERFCKFDKLNTIHNTKYITINKHHYTVYCFNNPIYNNEINNLKSFGKTNNLNANFRIYNFWKDVPIPRLNERLFFPNCGFGETVKAELPEEDYYDYLDKFISR